MPAPNAWYDEDAFWHLFEPVLFSPQRIARAGEEVDSLARLLPIGPGALLLDLCCGTGRHSLELARRGCLVTGVDRTGAYIEKARAAAAQESLAAVFAVADMRDYCEPGSFDVVVNLFGSFGYFEDPEDDRRVVANAYASLRPGGQFLIETMGKEILPGGFRQPTGKSAKMVCCSSRRSASPRTGAVSRRAGLRSAARSAPSTA